MTDIAALARAWHLVGQARQLRRQPRPFQLLGTPLVLFRTRAGQTGALLDRCPHRNVPLSKGRVAGDCLACPYHGWQFDTRGVCRQVPGLMETAEHPSRLTPSFPVVEQDGLLWVYAAAGEAPAAPPPRRALWQARGYTHFVGEAVVEAALPDALENFLDGTHTHFVHAGLIRTEGRRKTVTVIVRRGTDRAEAEYRDEGAQSGLIWRLFGGGIDGTFGRFIWPATAQLEYRAGGTVRMLITLTFTPETETRLRLFALVAAQAPPLVGALAGPVVKALFWQALQQDRNVMAWQAANLRRFGGARYVYTELDVLAPHILRLLKHGPGAAEDAEHVVRMQL